MLSAIADYVMRHTSAEDSQFRCLCYWTDYNHPCTVFHFAEAAHGRILYLRTERVILSAAVVFAANSCRLFVRSSFRCLPSSWHLVFSTWSARLSSLAFLYLLTVFLLVSTSNFWWQLFDTRDLLLVANKLPNSSDPLLVVIPHPKVSFRPVK